MIHYQNIQTARAKVCALESITLELQRLCDSGEDLRELETMADDAHSVAFKELSELERDFIYQENRLSNLRAQGFTVTHYGNTWKLEKGNQSKSYASIHEASKNRFGDFE
jgi:hypothetical protein